jgi:D-alanyl-D-alanine dipeptidase
MLKWLIAIGAAAIFAAAAQAGACPEPITRASRLVLVTASSMNTQFAKLQLFTRTAPDLSWKAVGPIEPAVIGRAGLAWGDPFISLKRGGEQEKIEGDKRTPAGFFLIGPSFGFEYSSTPGYIQVKTGETICVEDPKSPLYNRITRRSELGKGIKADDMGRTPLYRRGLFVDYPTDRKNRRGSCIFIHIWSGYNKGTAGCIALPEVRVKALQEFSHAGTVIAVLPLYALRHFTSCLPQPST